jgi:GH24 family phage-related lysozyme (muramidase)
MTPYIAGFSGLLSTGKGGTLEIAGKIDGAAHYASSSGYADWKEVFQDIVKKKPEFVALFGHSNGGYAVLKIAQALDAIGIAVDYLGIIDLTLKPSPPVYGNVKLLQEFHAAYAHVDLHETFNGVHDLKELDEIMGRNIGHSEAAKLDFTQNKIVETIASLTKGKPVDNPVEKPKDLDMRITPRTALEIAYHEGIVQEAYKDSVGMLTWSIGVTSASTHNVDRYIKNPATIDRCIEVYIWLLDTKYAPAVRSVFAGKKLTEAQFAAALSFHWNTGAIERATWVKEWLRGEHGNARKSILNWNKPSEIIPRRRAERDLFFDGDWSGDGTVAHYQGVSESGSPINPKRINIEGPITSAIDKHYSPAVPTDPNPTKPPVIDNLGSLDGVRAMLSAHLPDLTKEHADLAIAIALALHGSPEPPPSTVKQLDLPTNPPSAGFSLPNKGQQPEETLMNKVDDKKTYIGLAALAIVAFLNGYAGVEIPGVQLQDNWFEVVLGTGIGGGFAHKIQKLIAALRG